MQNLSKVTEFTEQGNVDMIYNNTRSFLVRTPSEHKFPEGFAPP